MVSALSPVIRTLSSADADRSVRVPISVPYLGPIRPEVSRAALTIRKGVELVLQALIATEATEVIGAPRYERTEARTNQRNASRNRLHSTWAARPGLGAMPPAPGGGGGGQCLNAGATR